MLQFLKKKNFLLNIMFPVAILLCLVLWRRFKYFLFFFTSTKSFQNSDGFTKRFS